MKSWIKLNSNHMLSLHVIIPLSMMTSWLYHCKQEVPKYIRCCLFVLKHLHSWDFSLAMPPCPLKFRHRWDLLQLYRSYKSAQASQFSRKCHQANIDNQYLRHFLHHSSNYLQLHSDLPMNWSLLTVFTTFYTIVRTC